MPEVHNPPAGFQFYLRTHHHDRILSEQTLTLFARDSNTSHSGCKTFVASLFPIMLLKEWKKQIAYVEAIKDVARLFTKSTTR